MFTSGEKDRKKAYDEFLRGGAISLEGGLFSLVEKRKADVPVTSGKRKPLAGLNKSNSQTVDDN